MYDVDAQRAKAAAFGRLHVEGPVLQVANAWDAPSARIMAAAGAPAIGTTSFGVALAHGVMDGEQLPFDAVVQVAAEIVGAVEVPVTVDIEAGHGITAAEVGRSVAGVIGVGAVGVNIEDAVPGAPGELFAVASQSERLAAARAAADAAAVPVFVNARCDVFFGAQVDADRRVDEVLERARHYREAGASGLFLPGLVDLETIRALTAAVDLPVNVMVGMGLPGRQELADAGVRRISQGGEPFLVVAGTLKTLTEQYLAGQLASPLDVLGAGVSVLPALIRRSD